MKKIITEQDLMAMVADPDIPFSDIAAYFEADEAASQPFAPKFRTRSDLIAGDVAVESALGLSFLNRIARFKRQQAFHRDAPSRPGDLRLVSDGDSWFLHPLLSDVVNHLYPQHLVFSVDGAGDELSDMVREKQALRHIERIKARGVLLSGGGNDLVGAGAFKEVLRSAPGGSGAKKYIDKPAFAKRLADVMNHYNDYVDAVLEAHPNVHVFLHGYDYAQPVPNGHWLGEPMSELVPPDKWADVVRVLIDTFNEELAGFADSKGERVHHINARDIVRGRWSDELHPTDQGYADVARVFSETIQDALRPPLFAATGLVGAPAAAPPVTAAVVAPALTPAVESTALPPLAPHMLAPVAEADDPNAYRRRAALLLAEGRATQIVDEIASETFVLPPVGAMPEVVLGESDFKPARFLRDGASRARVICRVRLSIGGSGTGSLLRGGFIFTNWHVLPSADIARASIAEFGFEDGGELVALELDPDRFFFANRDRDFAIVACDASALGDVEPLTLSLTPNTFLPSERVNIIQHPSGRPKEVAFRDNRVIDVFQGAFHYRTDTEPGSSGSPVFNDDWELVGLHRAGKAGEFNQAIRIDAITAFLESQFRGQGDEAAAEVMSAISGTSPHLGFFGRAGVIDELRPEVEIPTFRGDCMFADIGFWNIENFFGSVAENRIERVARLLSDINMDAIGLIEVGRSQIEETVRRMRQMGERTGHVFLNTRDSRDLAILFDEDTTQVTVMDDVMRRHEALIEERIQDKTVFPREPLIARVRVAEADDAGVEFAMIVVHLKSKAGRDKALSARRRARAAEILRIIADDIRDREQIPVILGGDYNEELSNDVLSGLTDAPDFFTLTSDDEEDGAASFLSPRFMSLIDHVIVAGDLDIGEIQGDDLAIVRFDQSISDFDPVFSDHTPLVMRLVLRDEPSVVEPDRPDADADVVIEIPDDADTITLSFDEPGA